MSRKIGVIVDGQGDYASLTKRFTKGYKILKTDGPRGHTAIIGDIVTKSAKQIAILKAFMCRKVIILLDFESRSINYDDFLKMLSDSYKAHKFGVQVDVAVPNRMIENWYLADIEHLSKKKSYLKDSIKQKNYEGTNGKVELKKQFKKSFDYYETVHGPELFSLIRFDVAKNNSPSLSKFLSLM